MKLYSLINPSDQIVFAAPSHEIAFFCAMFLGNGKTPTECEDGTRIESLSLFENDEQVKARLDRNLGAPVDDFIPTHSAEIIACFRSFRYGSFEDHREIESLLAELPEQSAKRSFLEKHEDKRRSSISRWVKGAWDFADGMEARMTERQAA